MWTATVASTPERPLAELWSELDTLYRYMVSGNWLGRRVQGYVRCIEIERTAEGWHVHAHTLLVFENEHSKEEVNKLSGEIKARYLKRAEALKVAADERGQDVSVIPIAQLSGAVNYVTKSHIGTGPSSTQGTRTPTMLLRAASDGDADAFALFTELENAGYRRRRMQTGGMFSNSYKHQR